MTLNRTLTQEHFAMGAFMSNDDLKELIGILTEKNILEFTMERENSTVRIKRDLASTYPGPQISVVSPSTFSQNRVSPTTPPSLPGISIRDPIVSDRPAIKKDLHFLRSNTVGIFHDSKVPGGLPYGETGKRVKEGQITGFIEILRLMVEIESDVEGEIVEKFVNEGDIVEYGQTLFAIRPGKDGLSIAGI
jgi:acetyl-CoA carboxylase biotin carboxyl carrier protein